MAGVLRRFVSSAFIFLLAVSVTGCIWQEKTTHSAPEMIRQTPVMTMTPSNSDETEGKQADSGPSPEDLPLNLSIEEAVMSALRNNQDLRFQRLEPVIAGTFEKIERASFDPEVFAEIAYSSEDDTDTSQIPGEQVVTETSTSAMVGIRQVLPTGTTLQVDADREWVDTEDNEDEHTTGINLSLTQSLLKGLRPSVNLAGIRQAELDTAISNQELRGYTETIVANTEIAYWQYVLANRKIAIFERSLEIAANQLDEIEQQINVGILPKTEAAAARSEVALREQDVIDARSAAEKQRLKLLQLINYRDGDLFDLVPNLSSKPEIDIQPVTDIEERILLAEKKRSDLNEARLKLEQNRLETIMTKNGILPRLDFFMTLGRVYYNEASWTTEDMELDAFTAGLRLTHVLGNRGAGAKDRAARASRRQAGIAVENLLAVVRLDVRLAVNEVMRAGKQVNATRVTRIFQKETYTAEKDRFDVGSSTALTVSQALRDLMEAHIAEVEAIVNFRIALIRLYLAEGSLLDMRGINIAQD